METLVALSPLLFLLLWALPIIGAMFVVLQRTDLTNFQLWGLTLMIWLLPFIGPIAVFIYTGLVNRRRTR